MKAESFSMYPKNHRVMLRYFTLMLTLLAGLVQAQDTHAQENNGEGKANKTTIETIVITGSRQASELLNFTGNIDRISNQDIEQVSAVHPSDILNRATSVHIQANNGMELLPSLRSPILTGPGAAGAFLFLEDGIATRAAGFANNNGLSELNLAQAEQIEVIRGPASAVYGSNAVHGVINVLTKVPSDDNDVSFHLGPNDRYQLQGTVGRVMGEHGVSLNFQAVEDAGYRDDSDFSSYKLSGKHQYEDGSDSVTTMVSGFVLDQNTAGFISSGDNGSGCYSSTQADKSLYKDRKTMEKNCDDDAYRKWSSFRLSSHWDHVLSSDTHISITPYFRINEMEFRQHYLPSEAIEKNSHYSVGIASNYYWQLADTVALVMGIDAEWTEGKLAQIQQKASTFSFGNARQQGVHFDYKVDASTIAPYIQGDWQVNDALKFTGSLRYDATLYQYDNLIADGTIQADGRSCVNSMDEEVACLFLRPMDRNDRFNKTSTKLGFNYQLASDTALFGAWSQGFRAPQITDLYRLQKQQVVGEINSEEINSVELGIRGIKQKLSYEAVIYTMKKNNFFFRDADGLNVTDGKTAHKGIELGIKYDLNTALILSVNYSYGQHKYEFDRQSSGVIKGNDIDTAPEHLANARISWLPTTNTSLELEWQYMGDYFLDPANEHIYDGHTLWQLRGSMDVNPTVKLSARIENLLDEKYASRADYAFGSYRFFGGQPRAFHLGITVNF